MINPNIVLLDFIFFGDTGRRCWLPPFVVLAVVSRVRPNFLYYILWHVVSPSRCTVPGHFCAQVAGY